MKLNNNLLKAAGLFGFVMLTGSMAFGLPWDIDMADAQTVKAYEREMGIVPPGAVIQDSMLSTVRYAPNYDLGNSTGLTNPLESSPTVLAKGEKMFQTYCGACHGDGKNLGKVAAVYPGVAVLTGKAGRLQAVPDGRLYVTIRNGLGLMPSYGWAMNEDEIWSLVHYLRTMDNGRYTPPAPAQEPTP